MPEPGQAIEQSVDVPTPNVQAQSLVEQIAAVVAHAGEVLESKSNVMIWLREENDALGGHRPLDFLESGDPRKIREVDQVLGRIEYGMFS